MKRLCTYMLLLLAGMLGLCAVAGAETAAELDARGLSHFGKAFHEATPHKEAARAASEYGQAEAAFQEAIRQKPGWVEPYLHLGRTYFVQQKYPQAAELYRRALTMAPERKEIYLQLASALEMGGDYEGAVKVLQTLRAQETDERAIAMLDKFIKRLQARVQAPPTDKPGGR